MPQAYILEGTWTGYTSAQTRIVHREVISDPKRIANLKTLHEIVYTDGTALLLHLREEPQGDPVKKMDGYGSLIRQAEKEFPGHPVVYVSKLY